MAIVKRLSKETYIKGLFDGDKIILSKAITLAESTLHADKILSQKILTQVLPNTGSSLRIGITGVPGAGKSTFIEAFGKYMTSQKNKVAVLTVDPSSRLSKGSILGDKTRMESLSTDSLAFIRPTPAGDFLGGVSQNTRKAILLCEAAGYNIIIIETVGVGQSEAEVHGMVDFFLLLMLTGAGDELQNIKKGILEMTHAIAINKAEGENKKKAENMKIELEHTFHSLSNKEPYWQIPIVTCSALKKDGVTDIWEIIKKYEFFAKGNGWFQKNRNQQNVDWMYESVKEQLVQDFFVSPAITAILDKKLKEVFDGKQPAINAAAELIKKYKKRG